MSKGIFVKQTKTRLVKGRQTFKVRNTYAPSCENAHHQLFDEQYGTFKPTDLELLYKEFCQKAYSLIRNDESLQADNTPEKVVFYDFIYEVVPTTITVE